jgi:hypothetical protein
MHGFEDGARDHIDVLDLHPNRAVREAYRYGRTRGATARDTALDEAAGEFDDDGNRR